MQKFTVRVENKHAKKKGSFSFVYLLTIPFVIVLLVGGYYLWNYLSQSNTQVNQEMEKVEFIEKTSYFIAQTNFRSIQKNITFEELKARRLYFSDSISPAELDELKSLLSLSEVIQVEPTYESFKTLEPQSILILYPNEADYRLKSLDIEGVSIWSKDSELEDYPLVVKASVEKDREDNLADNLNIAKNEITTLFVGGEIIASRAVDRLWINKTDNSDFLFDRVKVFIERADISLAMLENSYYGNPTPCTGCTVFVSDEKVLTTFKNVGFDVLSLATNHEGDGGAKAALNTRTKLDELGIKHFGSGDNIAEAIKPAIVEANGMTFAFIGGDDIGYFYWAGENEEGTNYYSTNSNGVLSVNKSKIEAEVKAAKEQADVVVIMMTWGVEYTNKATKHQEEMAQAFVDSGADLIVSSHPHWVQNIQSLTSTDGRNVPVVYSLGNFIFDQTHTEATRQGMLAEFTYYDNKLVDINLIPHLTCGYHQTQNNFASKVVAGELTYEQVDAMPESQGCIWWQPKPVLESDPVYAEILNRVFEFTNF